MEENRLEALKVEAQEIMENVSVNFPTAGVGPYKVAALAIVQAAYDLGQLEESEANPTNVI